MGGPFTLASGRESHFYFDMKPLLNDPKGLTLIASLFLKRLPPQTTAVGGLSDGSIPISTTLILLNERKKTLKRSLKGFWVREAAKDHGLTRETAGEIGRSDKAVVVDDVTTEGSSVLRAVRTARTLGAQVLKVMTVVDREEGAASAVAGSGLELIALFRAGDFLTK